MRDVEFRGASALARDLAVGIKRDRPLLIAVDGFAGSGKSVFARDLAQAWRRMGSTVTLVRFDDFWHPRNRSPAYFRELRDVCGDADYDYDWVSVRAEILHPFAEPRAPIHLFERQETAERPMSSNVDYLIVEGFSSLRRELSDYYDYRIFMVADKSIRRSRLTERDGQASQNWYNAIWALEEHHYMAVHMPLSRADLVIDTSAHLQDR